MRAASGQHVCARARFVATARRRCDMADRGGPVYWTLYHVLRVALWGYYRDIRVVGTEHVPRRRPVLICG